MRSLVVLFAVIAAAVAAPSVALVPSAVSHQSRVDVHSSPAVVTQYVAEPVLAAHVVADPVVEARAVYATPAVYAGNAAVSHQSRVDVHSSPAVVASAPVIAARAVYTAPISSVYVGGSAVSHQSRVDVQSSPAVVSEHIVAPAVVEARSVLSPAFYSW